jgi:ubiquinone/menaquinone biosynthesis C-methylase UbiE
MCLSAEVRSGSCHERRHEYGDADRVVDIACDGIVARIAAVRVGPTGVVVGVDLNPGMLSVARSGRLPPTPAQDRISA